MIVGAKTTTGRFPIGFRRMRQAAWQQDLASLAKFAEEGEFAFVDFGPIAADNARAAIDRGIAIGSVDLKDWSALLSPDAGERKASVVANASHMRSLVEAGVKLFLAVLTPADAARSRRENFEFAVESYRSLADSAGECGARIVLEGAPGRPPHLANLGCTPADLGVFFDAVKSPAVGINYDPSHLVRMGIDPLRFLKEFSSRIYHVHAKDTLLIAAEQYLHGTLQQATFAEPHVYGGYGWRYVLPGRGAVNWRETLATLAAANYTGAISIELEDADCLGDEAAERRGLIEARRFLQQV
jgi:sugar phosphate isomerase/epimerase